MKDFVAEMDPEVHALNARLLEISRLLQSGLPLDDRPEGARSPSPEPVNDNLGISINAREYRARERLNRERQEIIPQLIRPLRLHDYYCGGFYCSDPQFFFSQKLQGDDAIVSDEPNLKHTT